MKTKKPKFDLSRKEPNLSNW